MKIQKIICLFLFSLILFSYHVSGNDLFDYYISLSFLTNFHTKNVYYYFEDMSQFNYHYRPNQTEGGYYEPNSVYSKFTGDRFNKAQYSMEFSVKPKNADYLISLEYSFIDGIASFPLLGGSKADKEDLSQTIMFLERDNWSFSRHNIGIAFKGLLKDMKALKVYYVLGIDHIDIDFDIVRHSQLIKNNDTYSSTEWQRTSYSGIGYNFFIESKYTIYKEINLFLKLGYKYYRGNNIKIASGHDFQHSEVYFNPSSISFQLGIIHKVSR